MKFRSAAPRGCCSLYQYQYGAVSGVDDTVGVVGCCCFCYLDMSYVIYKHTNTEAKSIRLIDILLLWLFSPSYLAIID
jgi:hypothetical protein